MVFIAGDSSPLISHRLGLSPFTASGVNMTSSEEGTLNDVLDIISEGVWIWNALTGHVYRSPSWYRMLGLRAGESAEDVLTWEKVIHPDDYVRVMNHFEAYICGRISEYRIQYRCIRSDGSELWIEDSGRIVERTADGSVARMIGAHTNIHEAKIAQNQLKLQQSLQKGCETLDQIIDRRVAELAEVNRELEEKVEEFEHIATHDSLTGLYNRHMFESLLKIEIKRFNRYRKPFSMVLADVDLFKEVNDQYGHLVGDQVLRQIACLVRGHLRQGDILCRWGRRICDDPTQLYGRTIFGDDGTPA
ncbi:MAG: sensor domain-containing diguanylate cyclase [Pseudomonadales bacterium]